MRWRDTPTGYGWLSIVFHWGTALAVLSLWFVGASIAGSEGRAGTVRLHTTIALTAYLLLIARIAWRLSKGHPGPLPGQQGWEFSLGKLVHYLLLAAISVMVITGPLMAWTGGEPLLFFDLAIPSPFSANDAAFVALHEVHRHTATVIILATLLHILGVVKHMVFNRDGTFDKIMVPAKVGPAVESLPASTLAGAADETGLEADALSSETPPRA
jgi:cytochrome b561